MGGIMCSDFPGNGQASKQESKGKQDEWVCFSEESFSVVSLSLYFLQYSTGQYILDMSIQPELGSSSSLSIAAATKGVH